MQKVKLFFFFLGCVFCQGQETIGYVYDKDTNNPLRDVNIFSDKYDIGTTTDNNGRFVLKSEEKFLENDLLQFSILGYKSDQISILKLITLENKIFLQKKIEYLDEVYISSEQKRKPQIKFEKLSSLRKGVYSFGSIVVDNFIYVIGGNLSNFSDNATKVFDQELFNPNSTFEDFINRPKTNFRYLGYNGSLQIYDILNDTWTIKKKVFKKRAYHKVNLFNDKLYIIGGIYLASDRKKDMFDDTIEIFDLKTETISELHSNPHHSINFESLVFENFLITLGGSKYKQENNKKIYSNEMSIYNIKTNRWYEFGHLETPKEVKGFLLENHIYIIGNDGEKYSTIESYNIDTKKWRLIDKIPLDSEKASIAYHDDDIYIYSNGSIIRYNISDETFNRFKIALYVNESALLINNNFLYLVGGYIEEEYGYKPTSGVYRIDLNEFNKTDKF